MIVGAGRGISDYEKFEEYVREKYPKQLEQLDAFFRPETVKPEVVEPESPAVTVEGENVVVQ